MFIKLHIYLYTLTGQNSIVKNVISFHRVFQKIGYDIIFLLIIIKQVNKVNKKEKLKIINRVLMNYLDTH